MNKKKKETAIDTTLTLSQIITTIGAGVATGANPLIVAGGAIVTQFFGLRGKIKTKRVNTFVGQFIDYIKTIDSDFDSKNVDNDSFQDFFEELLIYVSKTSSEEKLRAFRNILVNQIFQPKSSGVEMKYLELLDKLSESQIVILNHWIANETRIDGQRKKNLSANTQAGYWKGPPPDADDEVVERFIRREDRILKDLRDSQREIDEIEDSRETILSTFSKPDFELLIMELKSLGLLDMKASGEVYYAKNAFEAFKPSNLAYSLFEIIRDFKA